MNTEEILLLMGGMATNKIATLEFGDLKLHSQPAALPVGNAASGMSVPKNYSVTTQDAFAAVAAAKAGVVLSPQPTAAPAKPTKTADERLAEMQARTAAVRGRAASGISSGTSKAIKQIFKEAKQPPSAPKPTTT